MDNIQVPDFLGLLPETRIRNCRLMAKEAQKFADLASGEMKAAYADLARHWNALADSLATEIMHRS